MPLPKLTRRRLLQGAAGAVVLAAVGEGIDLAVDSSPASSRGPRFRSEPSLRPPPVDIVTAAHDTASGYIFQTLSRTRDYQHGPTILDDASDLIYFASREGGCENLQVQTYQGQPVLTFWHGKIVMPTGYGSGETTILDSSYRIVKRVKAANGFTADAHEFVITPRDTALFTIYHPVKADLSSVGGPKKGTLLESIFQEVDIATGKLLFEWRASDHVPLKESYAVAPQQPGIEWDFFHINSIDVDSDGNYIVSGRETCSVKKIDSRTGAVIWTLGGKASDFTMGPGSRFYYQHHARVHANHVMTIFDDGAAGAKVEKQSRGIKLHVDQQAMTAKLIRAYLPNPSVLASSQGSMQLLADGDVFIGWGVASYYSEYAEAGRQRLNAHITAGSYSYRAFRAEWTGRPHWPPAIAVDQVGSAHVDVFASWNGSTELAAWNVLAGDTETGVTQVASRPRHGFETTIPIDSTHRYFAVQALDSSGRVLAQSATVRAARA